MRHLAQKVVFLAVPLGVAFSTFGGAAQAPFKNALNIYDKATAIVADHFYDQTFRGLSWATLVHQYRLQLGVQSSADDLEAVVNDLLQNLHASHTEFLSFADQEYHGLESIFSGNIDGDRFFQIGAWFQNIDGKWFVRDSFPAQLLRQRVCDGATKSSRWMVNLCGRFFLFPMANP
jgi:C-terminal processing protease CtpA/Prc